MARCAMYLKPSPGHGFGWRDWDIRLRVHISESLFAIQRLRWWGLYKTAVHKSFHLLPSQKLGSIQLYKMFSPGGLQGEAVNMRLDPLIISSTLLLFFRLLWNESLKVSYIFQALALSLCQQIHAWYDKLVLAKCTFVRFKTQGLTAYVYF